MKKNNKKAMQTFETFAPLFPGFYGTIFEYDSEESDIESYNKENGTNLNWEDFKWDYADYRQRISKAFVNRLEAEIGQFLPIKIEFEELVSPKECNFQTDSINIKVELNLDKLLHLISERKEKAAEYFKDKYTSCDGFISSHSNDIDDWLDKDYILYNESKAKHRVGALLDCLCTIEIEQDDIYYWTDSEMWIDFEPIKQEA